MKILQCEGHRNYTAEIIEKIIVERNKKVDSAILGEINKIATEEGIETKIILNKKNVADALRNYQDGYATVKAEVAREFIKAVDEMMELVCAMTGLELTFFGKYAELKKKYTEGNE